jgi:hypothetical protein
MRRALAAAIGLASSLVLAGPAAASDTAPVDSAAVDSATQTLDGEPVIALAEIDPDALAAIARALAIRGFDPGPLDGASRPALDLALRKFASREELPSPPEVGRVGSVVIDALGVGDAVLLRWVGEGPRAPELARDEVLRLNEALRDRGYRTSEPTDAIDADTVAALRRLQRETGHPVQKGEVVERRWLFILGVAARPASTPRP